MSDAPKPRKRARGAPRKLRFTREGRVFVLVTLGVGAAAVNTGNNLLYLVLGLLLSLIVLSGILSEVVLRDVRVRRRLPRRAFAGSACLVELELENLKPRAPSYSVELEDQTDGARLEGRCYFLKVGPGETQRASYRLVPHRRGILRLSGVIVRTRYPFSLFEKWRVLVEEDELLVYPALGSASAEPPGEGPTSREVPTHREGPGTEIAGLREYRDGDEARAIHWRRTASLGRMVVRERRQDAARRLTLVIDDARPDGADLGWDARFEEMLSRAATAAAQALASGAAVEARAHAGSSPLVLPGQPPDPIWRFLALLEARPRGEVAPPAREREPGVRRFEVGAA